MVVVRLLCEVQVCGLVKRMTRAEDGSWWDFISRFYPACPMGSSDCRAVVESKLRWRHYGHDDRSWVICSVLGRRKSSIIPL
jgi:hypothetical protein